MEGIDSTRKSYETITSDEEFYAPISPPCASEGPSDEEMTEEEQVFNPRDGHFIIHSFEECNLDDKVIVASDSASILYKAKSRVCGRVLVKVFASNSQRKKEEMKLYQQLYHFSHSNVIRFLGTIVEKEKAIGYMMKSVNGGTLTECIYDQSFTYSAAEAWKWTSQVAAGIFYLHSRGIAHRDIRPSNILWEKHRNNIQVKISDFGAAQRPKENVKLQNPAGTWEYMAPEILNDGILEPSELAYASDVYAFAITIWEIFNRKNPIDSNDTEFLAQKRGKTYLLEYWSDKIVRQQWRPVSKLHLPEVNNYLSRMWAELPEQRPPMSHVLKFFRGLPSNVEETRGRHKPFPLVRTVSASNQAKNQAYLLESGSGREMERILKCQMKAEQDDQREAQESLYRELERLEWNQQQT